jgi:uncharacterized protein YyaL (SSP411 family)
VTPHTRIAACGGDTEAAQAAMRVWGVTPQGNFEHSGASVLSVVAPPGDAREQAALERARLAMLTARESRPKPARDDKVLASWNALMIGALADAGAALEDERLLGAADRAMRFVEGALIVREPRESQAAPPTGPSLSPLARIGRMAKDGHSRGVGFLDDHAYVADAALDMYTATGAPHWVGLARAVVDGILAHFHDPSSDTFFFTPDDGEQILVRPADSYDHAVPSGATVACRALLRLGTLVEPRYEEIAARTIERLAHEAGENPFAMSSTVALVDRLVRGSTDVVVVGPRTSLSTRALVREVFRADVPDLVLAWLDPSDPSSVEACRALGEGKPAQGEPVAYVCRGRTCSLPLRDPEKLARELREATRAVRA